MEVAEEPGLLAAVEPVSEGRRGQGGTRALDLLIVLAKWENAPRSLKSRGNAKLPSSPRPCFSAVMDMAATGATIELKRRAWILIERVCCIECERRKAVLDSAGMDELLQAGLESKDDDIATKAAITVYRLCISNEVASTMLDSYPDLVNVLVVTVSTSGIGTKFECKSQPLNLTLTLNFIFSRFLSF